MIYIRDSLGRFATTLSAANAGYTIWRDKKKLPKVAARQLIVPIPQKKSKEYKRNTFSDYTKCVRNITKGEKVMGVVLLKFVCTRSSQSPSGPQKGRVYFDILPLSFPSHGGWWTKADFSALTMQDIQAEFAASPWGRLGRITKVVGVYAIKSPEARKRIWRLNNAGKRHKGFGRSRLQGKNKQVRRKGKKRR